MTMPLSPTSPSGLKRSNLVSSLEETQKLASHLASSVTPGSILTLTGELGAGKTTFIRFLVEALGGSADCVSSPTFNYLNEYGTADSVVYHFDLYRLKNVDEFISAGFLDQLEDKAICCIEWPERIAPLLGDNHISVTFIHLGDGKREIIVER
jgi:tRNA threonylcarbamoyladenosine biosynthesis protein TsaE